MKISKLFLPLAISLALAAFPSFGILSAQENQANISEPLTATIVSPSDGTEILVGESIDFSAEASGGLKPYAFVWNFGDNTSFSGANHSKTYNEVGNKNVRLAVTDLNGNQISQTITIIVSEEETTENGPLKTSIIAPAVGSTFEVGESIDFSAEASGGLKPYAFVWNFGDNTSFSGANHSKTYNEAGDYDVTVTTTDLDGTQDTASISLTITEEDDGGGTPTPTKPVISNIRVTDISETAATVRWTTDRAANSRVIYDTVSHLAIDTNAAPNFGYAFSTATSDNSPKVTEHAVTITGLQSNTTYFFRVLSQ